MNGITLSAFSGLDFSGPTSESPTSNATSADASEPPKIRRLDCALRDLPREPSEDEGQRHNGQDAKAQNGKAEWIVRGNLEHRDPQLRQRWHSFADLSNCRQAAAHRSRPARLHQRRRAEIKVADARERADGGNDGHA